MHKFFTRKFIIPIIGIIFISGGTYLAILWGQGYRPTTQGIQGTGLLSANSFPDGAQVFLNGKLSTATDDTLNLPPGEYQVEIRKEGFITWKKTLQVQAELVAQTNAVLFPAVVSLQPLTFSGAQFPAPSPNGNKIAFLVQNAATPAQNGLYVQDLSNGPISFGSNARQIAKSTLAYDLTSVDYAWSPDSSQILLHFSDTDNLLIDTARLNDLDATPDVTAKLPLIFSDWERQLTLDWNQKLFDLPPQMQTIATQSARNVYFSPDEKRLMYTATEAITIPDELVPPLPGSSTQAEERQLEPGVIYIYDLKEDRNFRLDTEPAPPAELGLTVPEKINLVDQVVVPQTLLDPAQESSPSAHSKLQADTAIAKTLEAFRAQYSPLYINGYQWFTTSSHLIINTPDGIVITEYDGTNRATIYSGPREENFVYPSPNGDKLIILTNLGSSEDIPLNLYGITLK